MKNLLFLGSCALALLLGTAPLAEAAPPRPGAGAPTADTPMELDQRYPVPAPTGRDAAFGIDESQAARARAQAQGDYLPLNRTLGLPLGTTQDAWSKPMSHMAPGQTAPGVVRFNWSPDMIMPIRIREFMVSMIVLPTWEQALDVFIGESQYIQAAKVRPNVIALRTGASGIDTTVTVVGQSGNLYAFYVRAEGYNTKSLTDVNIFVEATPQAVVADPGWFRGGNTQAGFGQSYLAPAQPAALAMPAMPGMNSPLMQVPGVPPAAMYGMSPGMNAAMPPAPTPPKPQEAVLPTPDKMIFNMRMYEVNPGDRAIAPELVYTDGQWTFFDYKSKSITADRPVVYRIVDGVETIVNTRTIGANGEILVAEGIGDFVLRNGQKTVCVKRIDGEGPVKK